MPTPLKPDVDSAEVGEFRVAVFARTSDPHLLAEVLCRVVHIRPLDAVIAARHTPGVLSTPMTASQSQQFVAVLHDMGIAAAAVAVADLPDLSSATSLHHVRCLDEGLQIFDLRGNPAELIPWIEMVVVAIGAIPAEHTPRFMDRGRPSVVSAAPLPEVGRIDAAQHHVLELWLLRRDGVAAYRLRHDHFNYDGLERAKSESATVNFDRFVRQLIDLCGSIRRTPSTHAYLAHEVARYEFSSSEELQQHALLSWVLDRTATAAVCVCG
jgi:hypothetical protein